MDKIVIKSTLHITEEKHISRMLGSIIFASVLTVVWAGGDDHCKGELKTCLEGLPMKGQGGLPVNSKQIDELCKAYQAGMECVESWNKECLPSDSRKVVERQMASAQLFMALLCADGAFKKEYLNHTNCFGGVSRDWERCNANFQGTVKEITDRGAISYTQRTLDTCCARFGFNRCITQASRAKCDTQASMLLRRISEALSQDSRCERFDVAFCTACVPPTVHVTLILLALILTKFLSKQTF